MSTAVYWFLTLYLIGSLLRAGAAALLLGSGRLPLDRKPITAAWMTWHLLFNIAVAIFLWRQL